MRGWVGGRGDRGTGATRVMLLLHDGLVDAGERGVMLAVCGSEGNAGVYFTAIILPDMREDGGGGSRGGW